MKHQSTIIGTAARVACFVAIAALSFVVSGCARNDTISSTSHEHIGNVTSPESFDQLVAKAEGPVLVDFWAPWCGPCRAMAPDIAWVAEHNREWLDVVKINVDNNQQLAAQYNVRVIPTLMVFHKGKVLAMYEGAMRRAALDEWIRQQLKQEGVSIPDPAT